MTTQRWIAFGVLILLVACAATSNLWVSSLFLADEQETEDSLTTTPRDEPGDSVSDESTPTPQVTLAALAQATMDPDVAEIMADMGIDELGVGIDPHVIRAGTFETIDTMHQGQGNASIYQFSERQRFLRLENFSVTSGPDLRVLLSQHETPRTSSEALLPSYLDLGELKNTNGAQNYELPESAVPGKYKSVVIYSVSLNIVYTSATLEEVRGQ